MKLKENSLHNQHSLSLGGLTRCQHNLIKGPLVNMDNRFNKISPPFISLHPEFFSSSRVIDLFSNCFSFYPVSKYNNSHKAQTQRLDNLTIKSSRAPLHALVITDTSVKNNTTTSISHIHVHNKPVIKTLYHTINIMSTEAKIFAIRYGINQATISDNISKIIIITDSIYAVKKIFDPLLHPFQCHTTSILNELQNFFSHNQENSIKFWECPSHCKWHLHNTVDKETKSFNPIPLLPCKQSWDFSKKLECDDIVNRWKMTFQASDIKGKHFLDLVDDDDNIIELSYIKDGSWLKFFGHSNSLCTRASRAITNHAPISEYRIRFFPREDFSCPCGINPTGTRRHILYECKRFNNYWNPRREFNPGAFAFHNALT